MTLTPAHLIVPGMPGFFGVRKPKAVGGSFVPTDLSTLVGWWDASDSGTITNDGTGHASQWNDKSSNGNNLTPQSTGKPTINAAGDPNWNNLAHLTFGVSTGLQKLAATGLPSTTTGIGFAAVFRPTSLATKVALSLGDHTTTSGESLILFFATTLVDLRTANVSGSASTVSYTDTTNIHLLSGTCSTALRDIYKDGTQGTSQATAETSKTSVDIAVGHQLAAANTIDYQGNIGEVVLFSGASSTDRQKLEGYLAWKWGLQGNLPVGHPYKSARP